MPSDDPPSAKGRVAPIYETPELKYGASRTLCILGTMARALPLTLLLACLSLVAWLLLGAGDRNPAHASGAPRALERFPAESTAALIGESEASSAPAPASGQREAIQAASISALDKPAISVSPAPDAPPQVIGRILDADGKPLPGARVIAATGWTQSIPLELTDLGSANDWFQRAESVSGSDGSFEISGDLQEGSDLALYVVTPGHVPLRVDQSELTVPAPHDAGDLELRTGRVARGRVVVRSGAGVPGARISLAVRRGEQGFAIDFPGRGVPVAVSGEDGAFSIARLDEGPFTLWVKAEGRLAAKATGVASAQPVEDLVVVLDPGSPIEGRLVNYDGSLRGALRIEARPGKPDDSKVDGIDRAHPGARVASLAPASADGSPAEGAAPDQQSAFTITGLVDGLPYTLVLAEQQDSGSWKRVAGVEPVEAWPGTQGVELRWELGRALLLKAVDGETGEALEGPLVAWVSRGSGAP